jgi:hypothetical protein
MPLLCPAWCRLLMCKLPIRPRLRWLVDDRACEPTEVEIECALGVAVAVAVDGRRSSGPRGHRPTVATETQTETPTF